MQTLTAAHLLLLSSEDSDCVPWNDFPEANPKYGSYDNHIQPVRQMWRKEDDVKSRNENSKRESEKNDAVFLSDALPVSNLIWNAHGSNEKEISHSESFRELASSIG